MEISLLAAVAECYKFKSKSKEILFEVRFSDVSRTVRFGKHWNKVLKQYEYFINETYCPCLASNETSFIGHLAKCSGIAFGHNTPGYKVIKLNN